MANLALVSCACGAVASAYGRTKERLPCVRSVCDAAEKGVKTLTAAAASGAQPLLTRLEPQSECGEGTAPHGDGGPQKCLSPSSRDPVSHLQFVSPMNKGVEGWRGITPQVLGCPKPWP